MTLRLFDSHAHVQLSQFDSDRDAMLERARAAGVTGMLVLGTDVASSQAAIALAEAEPGVYAAAGCHPHDAQHMDADSMSALAELARHPLVAAVGEIGLDFYRNFSPHGKQIEVFQQQLETAAEVEKPIAVHCRDANDALFPIIESWSRRQGGRLPDGRPLGVMHYFSGDTELAERYVELGFVISIHCSVTYPNANTLQAVAQQLPLDAMVIETDSPYGPPQSRRGQRNEPGYLSEAVAAVAELRDESIEQIAAATTETALRLFSPVSTAATSPALGSARTAERSAP